MAGQHYVPRFYLNRFGDDEKFLKRVKVDDFEKELPRKSTKSTTTIEEPEHKHSDLFEIKLGSFETPFSPALEKISDSKKSPTGEDRKILDEFTALTMVRNFHSLRNAYLEEEKGVDKAIIKYVYYHDIKVHVEDLLSAKNVSIIEVSNPVFVPDIPITCFSKNPLNRSLVPEYVFFPLSRNLIVCYYDEKSIDQIFSHREILYLLLSNAEELILCHPDDYEETYDFANTVGKNIDHFPVPFKVSISTNSKEEEGRMLSENFTKVFSFAKPYPHLQIESMRSGGDIDSSDLLKNKDLQALDLAICLRESLVKYRESPPQIGIWEGDSENVHMMIDWGFVEDLRFYVKMERRKSVIFARKDERFDYTRVGDVVQLINLIVKESYEATLTNPPILPSTEQESPEPKE